MKRVYICLSLIALMLFGGICSSIYVDNTTKAIYDELVLLEKGYAENDLSLMQLSMEKAYSGWNEFYAKEVFIVDKEHALEIATSLERLKALVDGYKLGEILEECKVSKRLVELYAAEQGVSIMNLL